MVYNSGNKLTCAFAQNQSVLCDQKELANLKGFKSWIFWLLPRNNEIESNFVCIHTQNEQPLYFNT